MARRDGRDIPSSEITPKHVYLSRRTFMKGAAVGAGVLAAGALLGPLFSGDEADAAKGAAPPRGRPLDAKAGPFSTDEKKTTYENVTTYNNFYEFGTGKDDPAENAHTLVTDPWSITVDGACAKPGKIGIEDLVKPGGLEERVYRHRCVEGWSMVIPWIGLPLGQVLSRFEPSSKAKYVAFQTLLDPKQMPGQRRPVLDWPYREGLRMDEAMHPLTLLSVGLYGEVLPKQNGAPVRLVVPWKYGFKSIKSIVRISFVEKMPKTSWNTYAPNEYGFYSNVNPAVDHPRWSQKTERRIGEFRRRDTLPFNGYGDEVASLYAGMDLRKWF